MVVSVMYPSGGRFDRDYYLSTHIPLVRERWTPFGLEQVQVLGGTGTPGGEPAAYQAVALLSFRSGEDFGRASKAHGREIFADIPKFTDVTPVVQFNEALT